MNYDGFILDKIIPMMYNKGTKPLLTQTMLQNVSKRQSSLSSSEKLNNLDLIFSVGVPPPSGRGTPTFCFLAKNKFPGGRERVLCLMSTTLISRLPLFPFIAYILGTQTCVSMFRSSPRLTNSREQRLSVG